MPGSDALTAVSAASDRRNTSSAALGNACSLAIRTNGLSPVAGTLPKASAKTVTGEKSVVDTVIRVAKNLI